MKILIVPDSFKGTLTSAQVCTCIAEGIRAVSKEHSITALPFADGGEGFTRISYCYSVNHIMEAMKRIRRFLQELKEEAR